MDWRSRGKGFKSGIIEARALQIPPSRLARCSKSKIKLRKKKEREFPIPSTAPPPPSFVYREILDPLIFPPHHLLAVLALSQVGSGASY